MPGRSMPGLGNELFNSVLSFTSVTYPTLSANASSTNTLTVPGVQLNDFVLCVMQSPPAHLFLDNAYVSAANTVTLTWSTDGTGITGASTLTILMNVARVDGANLGPTGFGSAVV